MTLGGPDNMKQLFGPLAGIAATLCFMCGVLATGETMTKLLTAAIILSLWEIKSGLNL